MSCIMILIIIIVIIIIIFIMDFYLVKMGIHIFTALMEFLYDLVVKL